MCVCVCVCVVDKDYQNERIIYEKLGTSADDETTAFVRSLINTEKIVVSGIVSYYNTIKTNTRLLKFIFSG